MVKLIFVGGVWKPPKLTKFGLKSCPQGFGLAAPLKSRLSQKRVVSLAFTSHGCQIHLLIGGVTLLGKCYASLPSQPSCQGTFLYTCSGRRPRVAPLRAAYPYPVLTVHAAPCPIQITSGGSAVLCNFQMKQYFVSKFLHGIGQIGMNIWKHYFLYECCKKNPGKLAPLCFTPFKVFSSDFNRWNVLNWIWMVLLQTSVFLKRIKRIKDVWRGNLFWFDCYLHTFQTHPVQSVLNSLNFCVWN